MHCHFYLFIILTYVVSHQEAANILGISHVPSSSHFFLFQSLLRRLAEKGHNVDIATHFVSSENPEGYNQLSLIGSLPLLINNISINVVKSLSDSDVIYFMTKVCGVEACSLTLQTPALQDLKKSKKKYDLVITEIFGSDCMLGFGHFFDVPTISLVTSTLLPWAAERIGNPDNPSYIPSHFFSSAGNLYERLENTIKLLLSKFLYAYFSSEESNEIAKEFFGSNMPSLEKLAKNTSLIITNNYFSIKQIIPAVPNLIEIGGMHIREPKILSKYFENLLSTDTKGIIYLTMGSMVLSESFDNDKLQEMFDAFVELPYKVLWKADREKLPKSLKIPENIHFEKWMPQIEILCHPNVKLFVTHGGLLSGQESVYCGVPRLGIPIFSDQFNNIRAAEKMGVAIKVAYHEISKEKILKAARKLLDDPVYKENSERASRLFKDRPMSPLDTAVYWVEYVIRHRGASHLRNVGADLSWYRYYLGDVIVVLCISFLTLLMVVVFLKFVILF
ncbi:UDP-glucosyltransferase 2-like isoform X2 [Tenebrio molitor]|uniref:UDP-glucosyltransferase 2-like isoform X2 n=1 Tax=Tenebrio molitor TaxID=7067 RepID=UPI0036246ECE